MRFASDIALDMAMTKAPYMHMSLDTHLGAKETMMARTTNEEVGQGAKAQARKKEDEIMRIKFLVRPESDPEVEGVGEHNSNLRRRRCLALHVR